VAATMTVRRGADYDRRPMSHATDTRENGTTRGLLTPEQAGRVSWMALIAIAALIAGIAVWFASWRPVPDPNAAPPDAPVVEDTSESVIDRALAQIPVDSAVIRVQWMDEVRDVDAAALDERQREVFVRYANARFCECGCGFTLAACRVYDPTCPVSLPLLEKLRDSVLAGRVRDLRGIRERPSDDPHAGSGS
jgi:hypothetical protein